jgi:hypothetical protein
VQSEWAAQIPGDDPASAALRGIVTGDRAGVPEQLDQRWRAVGIYHVLSVSGLHLAVVAGLAFALLRRLIAASPWGGRCRPARWAAPIALVLAIAYTLVTGCQLATLRALIVVAVALTSQLLDRPMRLVDALGIAAIAILGVAAFGRPLIPPAPLRLQEVVFAADLDRETLEPELPIEDGAASEDLDGRIVVLARIFAPASVRSRVTLDWYRGDELIRSAREVEIVAHEGGFRVWDALRDDSGDLPAGDYRIVVRTTDHRVFGSAKVTLR